jgi:hypothetical protein
MLKEHNDMILNKPAITVVPLLLPRFRRTFVLTFAGIFQKNQNKPSQNKTK